MIENYRSGLVWDLFMRNEEIRAAMDKVGFAGRYACVQYHEAEDYETLSGEGIAVEHHPTAWGTRTLQIGPRPGNAAAYRVTVPCAGPTRLRFKVRYADDVPGNRLEVYLDGAWKGSFRTDKFGAACSGWEHYDWDAETVDLGVVAPGVHTLTLQVAADGGGTWGVNLDVFKLYARLPVYLPLVLRR